MTVTRTVAGIEVSRTYHLVDGPDNTKSWLEVPVAFGRVDPARDLMDAIKDAYEKIAGDV